MWLARIRDVLRANDEDYLPELGKYNAGQKFVFWSHVVLIVMLFVTGVGLWEQGLGYFEETLGFKATIEQKRWAAVIHASAAVAGHLRLDRPCLCGDLGARHDQRHDPRAPCRGGWALAASPQVAAQGSRQG